MILWAPNLNDGSFGKVILSKEILSKEIESKLAQPLRIRKNKLESSN